MPFDEQPVDEHAECRREIHDLHAEVTRLQGEVEQWKMCSEETLQRKLDAMDELVKRRDAASAVLDAWEATDLSYSPTDFDSVDDAMDNLRIAAKLQADPTDDPDGEADRAHATEGDR